MDIEGVIDTKGRTRIYAPRGKSPFNPPLPHVETEPPLRRPLAPPPKLGVYLYAAPNGLQ